MNSGSKVFKCFPFMMFFISLIIVINGMFYVNKISDINYEKDKIYELTQEKQWHIIKDEIIKQYNLSIQEINYIAKQLECEILRQYGSDLDKLKQEFENDEFTQRFYNILKDILQDKDKTFVVGFRDKILSIFSNVDKDTSHITSWEQYFNSSSNIHLNQSLISNIINKNITENLLLYQLSNLDINSFTIPSHSVDALKELFNEKGLNGLKQIEYVCVAYITEYGDIFGTDDRYFLDNKANFKIMIVSTTNIYDSISKDVQIKLNQLDAENDLAISELRSKNLKESLQFIVITMSLIALIVVFGILYNQDVDHDSKYNLKR